MKQRIFIAINLPEEFKQEIITVQKKLMKFDWPVRWTSIDNLHITLRFIGLINNNEIDRVNQIVDEAIKGIKPLIVGINNFIAFPSLKMPRIICLNVEENDVLYNLQATIAGAIEEQGIGESERHPFTGHITLGRLGMVNANFRALTKIEFKSEFKVKSVEVMQSVLKPQGSEYSTMNSFNL